MLVQPEMEKRRFPLVSIPPFGRGFSRPGVYRSDEDLGGERPIPALPFIVSMSPRAIPRHGCVPAVPASVSPGKIIVAPQRPEVLNFQLACYSAKTQTAPDSNRECNCLRYNS